MKPRCQVLSRKWSKANSFVREKIQYKKSLNNSEVQSKPIKKRGVYVEKKTSNPVSSSLIQVGVKHRRFSGPSAEDKLNLIESALDVLSRMPVSLYPSLTKQPNLAAEGKHQLATPNISIRKEPQDSSPVIVIQSQKNIPNPSSIYLSHQSSINAMERMETEQTKPLPSPSHHPQPGTVTYPEMKNNRATETSKTKLTPDSEPKRNDTDKANKSTIEKLIENMALEDSMPKSTKDRSQSPLKKVPLTDGKPINTMTLVDKIKSSKRSNVSLYDFFVDLCKNKINYDPKCNVHGRKGHDDVSFSSVTDVDLAVVGNDLAQPDLKLSPNSSESETAIQSTEKPKPRLRLPPLRQNPAPLNQRRNLTTMNLRRSEPYSRGPSVPAKIRQSMKKTDVTRCLCPNCLHGSNDVKDWLRVDKLYNLGGTWRQPVSKQPKQSFKYKKNALLSSLREQLTVSATDVTSEPQNLYQALQKVIRSQKKAEKYKIKERRGTSLNWKDKEEDNERRSSGSGGRCLRRKTRNIKKIQVTPNDVGEPFRDFINSAYYDFY